MNDHQVAQLAAQLTLHREDELRRAARRPRRASTRWWRRWLPTRWPRPRPIALVPAVRRTR